MSKDEKNKLHILKDEEIVSQKIAPRRRMLAQMGIAIAAGATALTSKKSHAYDKKRVDKDVRDPDKD